MGTTVFGVQKYKPALEQVVLRRGIETHFRHDLIEILVESKEAIFEQMGTGEIIVMSYEMIHATPPMSPPDFVKNSPPSNEAGWVDVYQYSLQHRRYSNIFSLGDAGGTPNGKTGGIRKQAPVVVGNLMTVREGRDPVGRYNGYTSCPIITDDGKLILAELDCDNNPRETFPFNQARERRSTYWLKRYVLPMRYWHGMLKGRVYTTRHAHQGFERFQISSFYKDLSYANRHYPDYSDRG